MPRIPLASPDDLPAEHRDLFERLEKARGRPVGNLVRILAHSADLLEVRSAYGSALRGKTALDPRLRELAIMTVGRLTEAEYEYAHHWNRAVEEGVRREQLENLADFETSSEFDDRERAVMRYAAEVTLNVRASQETWDAVAAFLDNQCLVDLVLNVAWYNQTARVVVPLQIELEEDFKFA